MKPDGFSLFNYKISILKEINCSQILNFCIFLLYLYIIIKSKNGDEVMDKNILIILIGKRKEEAVKVQQILTAWGCIIKTRLGIHEGVQDNCSNQGLVILELAGTKEQIEELTRKVSVLSGVSAQLVTLKSPE